MRRAFPLVIAGGILLASLFGAAWIASSGEEGYDIGNDPREIDLNVTTDEGSVIIENPSETVVTVTAIHGESGDGREITIPGETTQSQILESGDHTLSGETEDREVLLDGRGELPVSISPSPAIFSVRIVEVTDPLEVGESLSVTAEIDNNGETEAEKEITLDIDDREGLDNTSVALGPGETETITLSYQTTEGDISEHDVTVRSPSETATETIGGSAESGDATGYESDPEGESENGGESGDEARNRNENENENENKSGTGADARDEAETGGGVGAGAGAGAVVGDGAKDADERSNYQAVDSCTVISEPGAYELTDDIEGDSEDLDGGSDGACIRINASDVVIEGDDNSVVGPGEEGTIGVLASGTEETAAENVTIRNLRAEGWDTGIQIGYRGDRGEARLESVIASENDGDGVSVTYAGSASIEGIEANGNGYSGIHVSEGRVESMANVTANGNGRDGVDLGETRDVVNLTRVTANGNGGSGIDVGEPKGAVNAEEITVSRNGGDGIIFSADVYESELTGVYASNNANAGLSISAASNRNTVRDSTMENNGGAGIRYVESNRNGFRNVTIRDNEGRQLDTYDDETFSAEEFNVGDAAEFAFEREAVSLDDVDRDELAELSEDARAIGDGVEIEGIENSVDVILKYDEIEGDGEIELWRYDGEEWTSQETAGGEVDGHIEAALTEDGIYVPVLVD